MTDVIKNKWELAWTIARWILGIAAIYIVGHLLMQSQLVDILGRLNYLLVVPILASHALVLLINAFQLAIVVRKLSWLPFSAILKAHYYALGYGVALPNSLSDVLIIPMLTRIGVPLNSATASFLLPKVINLSLLLIFALHFFISFAQYAYHLIFTQLDNNRPWRIQGMLITLAPIEARVSFLSRAYRRAIAVINLSWEVSRSLKYQLVTVIFLGVLKCCCRFFCLWVALLALGGDVNFWILSGASAFTSIVTLIPITPRSMGIYELVLFASMSEHSGVGQLLILASILTRIVGLIDVYVTCLLVRIFARSPKEVQPF